MVSTIREACHVLGFTSPPINKQELKKRFVELTKRHHPDRGGVDASGEKMMKIAESYKLLRSLIEKKVSTVSTEHRDTSTSSRGGHDADADLRAAAMSFDAPGFNVSSQGMWLPWQRQPTSSQKIADQRILDDPLSAGSFTAFASEARRVLRNDASVHEAAAKASSGSHGFDAAHLERQRRQRLADKGMSWSSSWISLVMKYYTAKVQQAPQNVIRSIRFVITGR